MTNLELKNALRALEARVAALEKRPEPSPVITVPVVIDIDKKLCPHCQKVPAHHLHVKACARKQKLKDGDDRRRNPSGP